VPDPILFEINTSVLAAPAKSDLAGRPITLGVVPDTELARWLELASPTCG